MKGILSQIIMPLPVLFLLITAGIFLLILKRKRMGKALIFISFIWLLIISTRPLPHLLAYKLENSYHQLADTTIDNFTSDINIIVLGAGFSDDPSLSPNNQLSLNALGRLTEGMRIYKRLKSLKGHSECRKIQMILSGYAGRLKISQAEVFYNTAFMLRADTADLLISPVPANTGEEAKEYLRLCGPSAPVIVVTDAVHMPRAIKNFRNAGLKTVPAPTNFLLKHGSVKSPYRWLPSSGNIQMMEALIHEYAGLLFVKRTKN